ncbi:MAG TPA: hypothetical protein PKV06_16835 [bacterium]|nr:hypothetical protein [bacterium]
MKKQTIFLLIFGLCSVSLSAQLKTQTGREPIDVHGGITSAVPGSLLSFIGSDRVTMTQSYAMTYYSGGGASGTLGMYSNSLNIRLSDPLVLRLNTGLMHQSFGQNKNSLMQKNHEILHGAELVYRPSRHFQMQVGYSNNPYYTGNSLFNPGPQRSGSGGLFDDYGFMRP